LVGDGSENFGSSDVIIQKMDGTLEMIDKIHTSYMPLYYHLLFSYCNSRTLNHVYLFNYFMLMVFSYLFIAFNHLSGIKKISFGPSLAIPVYLFIHLLTKIWEI